VITTSSTVPATTTVSEEEAEADADGDGIADDLEAVYGTDPALADTDNDGLSDGDELGFWGTRFDDDPDRDGLVNIRDFDSDNDGFPDGLELSQNADPSDEGSFPAVMQQILAGQGGSADESGAIRVFDAQNVVTEHMHARSRDESLTLSGKDVASLFMIRVSWPEYNEASGEVRIASGDIDGDNKDEIIVGLGPVDGEPDLPGGRFAVYDDNYACMLWGTIGWPEYNALNGESWPACGDIDADGSDEIFIGLGDGGAGKIEVFDFVGSKLRHRTWITTGWAEYEEAIGEARPACGNIDLDRADELIIGLGPVAGTSGLEGGLFEVLDNDLAVLEWGKVVWDEYNDMNGETRPACGDIDVDLRDEIIIGLGEGGDGRLVAFDYTPDDIREKQWMRIGWDEYSYSYGETRPAAGNIDFDFNDEIIVGLGPGGDGWIEAFDGAVNRYEPIMRVQLVSMDDTLQSGALWPAVKGISARNVLFRRMLKNMMHTMFTRR
jgi:hypothetical protein